MDFDFRSLFVTPEEATVRPFRLSIHNQLTLIGCNAKAALLGDNSDGVFSGCASFCFGPTADTPSHGVTGCYGMGCCQARISMSTQGSMPTILSLQQTLEYMSINGMSPAPIYVFITEEGWFDHQQGFSDDPRSVVTQDVPLILQWEVMPLGWPKPDPKLHPNCSWQVTKALCRSKNSYCKPGRRGYTCHCGERYAGNPYSPDNDGCKG
jgi:hypothetical protein